MSLVLHAVSSARDTDFTAKLVDVHPDGKAYNLCDGIIRVRYRNGMEQPALLEPGKAERFEIDLWVTSNLFKRGHRLRPEVSSSNFPRFYGNLNTGGNNYDESNPLVAQNVVHHSTQYPSSVTVTIVPASPVTNSLGR